MSSAALQFVQAVNPYSSTDAGERTQLATIDRSMRWPALFFLVSAVFWLLAGTVFGLIASFKLHDPALLGEWAWMTFGRVRSAHLNAMIYGWATNVGFAVALWIMARLSRSEVRFHAILLTAAVFWNIGVTMGIYGILAGDMVAAEWLEMPAYTTPLLAISYALVGVWGMIAFRFRRSEHIYVSQWYILGALFWFPWLYSVAQIMLVYLPVRGVVQPITNWWFAHNVLGLWLTPLALAAAYYLIPKVLGRPIHSYYLSLLGFWSLALFYNWAGTHHLIYGPVPVWVTALGTVASVMMVIPVLVTAINHHMTVVGQHRPVWASPTLRFVVFGSMSYTLVSFAGSAMALPQVNEITHFTHFTVGHAHHGVYAFYTMIMFGAIYFMMPRLLYREWPSAMLIKAHFWFCGVGIGMMVVALSVGGLLQGFGLHAGDPNSPRVFMDVVKESIPWMFARSISGILLLLGHVAFAVNFAWMLLVPAAEQSGPTLLANPSKANA